MSPPEWRRINFLLLSSLMMPNGREERGENIHDENGGNEMERGQPKHRRETAAKLGKFFVALFQKTRANGKNEDGEAERNRRHLFVTFAKFWNFLAASTLSPSPSYNLPVLLFSLNPLSQSVVDVLCEGPLNRAGGRGTRARHNEHEKTSGERDGGGTRRATTRSGILQVDRRQH